MFVDNNLYTLICDMIENDKIIAIDISFLNISQSQIIDHKRNRLTIDLNKLTNALKSTNCLNEFGICNAGGETKSTGYYEGAKEFSELELQRIEKHIKQGLLVNYSITELFVCVWYCHLPVASCCGISQMVVSN